MVDLVKIGIDTSGKINDPPNIVGCVRYTINDKAFEKAKEKAIVRKGVLGNRAHIKSTDFTKKELEIFLSNLKNEHATTLMTKRDWTNFTKLFRNSKHFKIKLLALQIYFTAQKIVKNNDIIVLDRDYDNRTQDRIRQYLIKYLKNDNKKIEVFTGSINNDKEVLYADLIAGCGRKKLIKPKPFTTETVGKKFFDSFEK